MIRFLIASFLFCALAFSFSGCELLTGSSDDGDATSSATPTETPASSPSETPTPTPMNVDFQVDWNADSVDLAIVNGDPAANYVFGLAETGCGDPGNCWYGEDCVYGDLTGTYFYCHPAGLTGVSLLYGGNFSALQEGVETVFGGPSFDGTITYYVEDSVSGDCWIWGHDTSYYTGLGCETL